jgi:SAM-dependent methyltransferase
VGKGRGTLAAKPRRKLAAKEHTVQNALDRHAWLSGQRRVYAKRYGCLRRIHDVLRYDARYRLFLLETLFRRFAIPFERQRVYELGFGTGSLLLRFDHTSALHGSELSESAVESLARDPRVQNYREVALVPSASDGRPRFPGQEYDVVLASHVIEHVPDDRETLTDLLAHMRRGGHAVFFLPLERPRHNPDHARTYTAAGFAQLLREVGFEPVFVEENFRYASHWIQVLNWPSRARIPVLGTLVEVIKTTLLALVPTSVVRLVEEPLARLHVAPYQLMVLARKGEGEEKEREGRVS